MAAPRGSQGVRGLRHCWSEALTACLKKPFIKSALPFHQKNANGARASPSPFVPWKCDLVLPFQIKLFPIIFFLQATLKGGWWFNFLWEIVLCLLFSKKTIKAARTETDLSEVGNLQATLSRLLLTLRELPCRFGPRQGRWGGLFVSF